MSITDKSVLALLAAALVAISYYGYDGAPKGSDYFERVAGQGHVAQQGSLPASGGIK